MFIFPRAASWNETFSSYRKGVGKKICLKGSLFSLIKFYIRRTSIRYLANFLYTFLFLYPYRIEHKSLGQISEFADEERICM